MLLVSDLTCSRHTSPSVYSYTHSIYVLAQLSLQLKQKPKTQVQFHQLCSFLIIRSISTCIPSHVHCAHTHSVKDSLALLSFASSLHCSPLHNSASFYIFKNYLSLTSLKLSFGLWKPGGRGLGVRHSQGKHGVLSTYHLVFLLNKFIQIGGEGRVTENRQCEKQNHGPKPL